MLRVGLTGGIASGKTAVSDRLGDLGAVVIDADLLARKVVEPDTPGLAAVVQRFGPSVLKDDRTLDRAALAQLVFADADVRRELERIIHPAVRARASEIEATAPADAIVVHVIPLLVETGQADQFDVVVVVDLDPAVQRERLQQRNAVPAADAEARISAQASREERLAAAHLVLDNSSTPDELRRKVDDLFHELRRRSFEAAKTVSGST